jgi:peptidoglycan/xylan/chitin deacetylase (PgdA/CDA1 family)
MSGADTAGDTIALMYHAVEDGTSAGADSHYTVGPSAFQAQMKLCAQIGAGVVSARDWLNGRHGVIATFDDGHQSNHRVAFVALAREGMTADFFVNPAQVGTEGFATWSELREMADGGMSIQSHGLDHRQYLTELSPERLREDLRTARLEIEARIGQPVTLLAPAGGRAPANLAEVAQEVGYRHVLDSRPGIVRRNPGTTFGRFAVTAALELKTLEAWLRGGRARLTAQVRYAALDLAKRALGDTIYERVRRRLLGSATS